MLTLTTAALACSFLAQSAQDQIQLDLNVRSDWSFVGSITPPPRGPAPLASIAVVRTRVATHPLTGADMVGVAEGRTFEVSNMRRGLSLEKTGFLLGEPILARLRVELDGPGTHDEPIGSNYRARGRDDNFLILMRHEDGTWARDPYAPIIGYMGGLGSTTSVSRDAPFEHWYPVPRWCVVDRPGTYDVYLLHGPSDYHVLGREEALTAALDSELQAKYRVGVNSRLVDRATDEESEITVSTRWSPFNEPSPSPLVQLIPEDVRTAARPWPVDDCWTYAHYRITVREGTRDERAEMVRTWSAAQHSDGNPTIHASRRKAAVDAVRYVQGDAFIETLAKWLDEASGDGDQWSIQYALAMNPNPRAFDLLIERLGSDAVQGMFYLAPEHQKRAIPHLIEWLTTDDHEVRAAAESNLSKFAQTSFGRDWIGYDASRPTLEEARAMQPEWRAWWRENEAMFEPWVRGER